MYAVVFLFASVLHFAVFETADVDLGHMIQPIWATLHGNFLETTSPSGLQQSRLGFHADPFLVLLVPFYWAWSSPLLLPVVQTLAVASGALPVYWLGRKHLGTGRAGAHFALAYLLFPATQFNAFTSSSSFHALSIALPLVLFAIWFLDEDRLLAFCLVGLLAATTKEEIPLAVGCLGLWYAKRSGNRRFGLSVFLIGLTLTLVDFSVVVPHFSPSGRDPFADRYAAVGGTPGGVLHKLFTDPLAFAHAVASGHKLGYVALLFGPLVCLWVFEPLLLLGALPELAINVLSDKSDQTSLVFYPAAGVVPFIVAASIFGAARFTRHAEGLSLCALVGVAVVAVYSPLWSLKHDLPELRSPALAAKAHAVDLIPNGAAVSASNKLGGHLATRRYLFVFPVVRSARWVVVDINDPTYADTAGFKRNVRRYEAKKAWRIVFSSHGVTVLRKRRLVDA